MRAFLGTNNSCLRVGYARLTALFLCPAEPWVGLLQADQVLFEHENKAVGRLTQSPETAPEGIYLGRRFSILFWL